MRPHCKTTLSRQQGAAVYAGVLLTHLALLALMARPPTVVATPQAPSAAMTVALFDASKPDGKSTPETARPVETKADRQLAPPVDSLPPSAPLAPPTPPPLDVVSLVKALAVAEPTRQPTALSKPAPSQPPSAVSLSQVSDSSTTCQMTQQVEAHLQVDPTVDPALQAIPRQARSVANAIMLWDGAWIVPGSQRETTARTALRTAILAAVAEAPEDCRTQTVLGPRLIAVPGVTGSTLLVLGSGTWRWTDLTLTAPAAEVG